MTSDVTTIVLPRALADRLREEARTRGVALEDLVVEILAADAPESVIAEAYWEAAEILFRQASEELERGDLRQASEKIWGSAALAVKAVACRRDGRRLTSHGELWEYVSKLVRETGDEELGRLWRTAVSMHVNFYEGWAPRYEVERALRDLRELLERLRKL